MNVEVSIFDQFSPTMTHKIHLELWFLKVVKENLLTQLVGLRFADIDPVEDLIRIRTLPTGKFIRGCRPGNREQRLQQQSHTIVDRVCGSRLRVALVRLYTEGPNLQDHTISLHGLERDLYAQR